MVQSGNAVKPGWEGSKCSGGVSACARVSGRLPANGFTDDPIFAIPAHYSNIGKCMLLVTYCIYHLFIIYLL